MFQSLFFWNGLWDSDSGDGYRYDHSVSILVFLEWPLGRYPAGGAGSEGDQSFNPCFSGMAFGTKLRISVTGKRILKFQSLFFWNGLWDKLQGRDWEEVIQVSILVFLEWPLGLGALHGVTKQAVLFQSLFFWNGLWDGLRSGRGLRNWRVSILVFLEWPLGRYWYHGLH